MRQSSTKAKPPALQLGRPLLAWRPGTTRGVDKQRALFAVHSARPQLIAAWHRGDTLDAAKAQQLWATHRWQLISPPPDVAGLVAAGQPLLAAPIAGPITASPSPTLHQA
jgi:hypothetical protein